MSNANQNTRDGMIEGSSAGGGAARVVVGILFFALIAVGAYFLLLPSSVDTDGPDTSRTADIQNPEGIPGVDTTMPAGRTVETVDVSAPAPMRPAAPVPQSDDGSAADRERVADLERELEALRNAQGDDVDVQALLADARAEMQDQFDRERAEAEQRYQLQLAQLTQSLSSGDTGMTDAEREARQRLEEERQRRAAIEEAQIMSDGIVLDASGARTGSGTQGGAERGDASGRTLSSNEQFMASASTQSYETVRATRIAAPGRTIVQGTTLNAVLETAISTELPGVIRAVVTDDVMSYDGMNVLLPQGTRLIGSYNSDVSVVQDRVQMAWNRAVTPAGVSVELGGYGADALGRSGQSGYVDSRFRERFGSAALISLIGVGPEVVINENSGGSASDAAEDVGDDLSTATQGVLGDYLGAGPVIYIDQGTYMTVFVNRDLVL